MSKIYHLAFLITTVVVFMFNFDKSNIKYGLDIEGGSSITFIVDGFEEGIIKEKQMIIERILRTENIEPPTFSNSIKNQDGGILIYLKTPSYNQHNLMSVLNKNHINITKKDMEIGLLITKDEIQTQLYSRIHQGIEKIKKRLDFYGLNNPTVVKMGKDKIYMELPNVFSEKQLETYIQLTQISTDLGFYTVNQMSNRESNGWYKDKKQNIYYDLGSLVFDTKHIENCFVKQRNEEPVIVFELDTAGRIALGDYTTKHRGEQLAILLNGSVLTAPLIDQPLTEGVGEISGQFTIDEAKMITTSLLTGNIPLKLKVVETKQIEPTLSNENLKNGIYSILVAVTVLVGWLLYYYKPYHGGVVVLGLFVNVFLVFDVIYTLEINITLMGLVAILLTLGMNVDNNILIQEKHREGYPILESYDKAKRGIFDANITTLLMGLVLYGFGQENIKQFGFMLLVGIVGGIYSGFYFTKSLYKNKEAKQWKH